MRETKEPTGRRARPLLLACLVAVAACGAEDRLPTGPEPPTSSINAGGTCELGLTETEILAEIAALRAAIDALEAGGALNAGQALALRNHLNSAERALAAGNLCAARASLRAFREQVTDFVADGVLSEGEARPLLEGADRALGETPIIVEATVTAGGIHTCGLTASGQAYCWGYGGEGQLGNGALATLSTTPVPVVGDHVFTRLSAGGLHTCGLTPGGAAYCWGSNRSGQLGDGNTTNRAEPVPVAALGGEISFAAISSGASHNCGLTPEGAAYCWGFNTSGQLGDASTTERRNPVPVVHPTAAPAFSAIASGYEHSCAMTPEGTAYCWGANDFGQLGNGSVADATSPVAVTGAQVFTTLGLGTRHTCGLTAAGEAYCWGFNNAGALGDGTRTDRAVPAPVVPLTGALTFSALDAGYEHACGVATTGEVYCWGSNTFGQLGNGTTSAGATTNPVAVNTPVGFSTITGGLSHSCGLSAAGDAYCWGHNLEGQLGNGSTTDESSPVAVTGWPALP